MPMRKPFCTTAGWSELVINELQDWLCVISPPPSPRFLHSTPSVLNHLGFTPEDMVGCQLVDFLHADDVDVFTREMATSSEATYAAVRAAPPSIEFRTVNAEGCVHTTNPEAWGGVWPSDPQLDYCCPFRVYGRFRRKDGRLVMLELDGRPYFLNHPAPNVAPSPTCFFVVGRTYPSKPASLLDSFLELKMENERLKRRLEEMAAEDASREPTDSNETASTAIGSKSDSAASSERSASSAALKHVHAAASASSTVQVNKQLLESEESSIRLKINSFSRTVISVSENNASVDMSSDIEENENVVGDSGSEQNFGNMKKRKKEKKDRREDDQGPSICVDCGALKSPEWRKGPMGPKTLCNACGLRWAKRAKKAARASKDWDSLPTLLGDDCEHA